MRASLQSATPEFHQNYYLLNGVIRAVDDPGFRWLQCSAYCLYFRELLLAFAAASVSSFTICRDICICRTAAMTKGRDNKRTTSNGYHGVAEVQISSRSLH